MKLLALSAFLMVVPSLLADNIFLDNLKPEEAQKYLASHDLGLKYAPKIGESGIPSTRAGAGEYWYRGRKITNPGDYVEETYLANQFHGQDGLGRALFGYSDWNQGRVEAINGNGHVRGTYKYVDPNGKDFVANYWSDGLGFHQEDNRPVVKLEPVTDTPAVQRARQEHFRKWNEIAEQAKANPDPYSDYYNRNANRYDEDQDKIDQALEIIGSTSNQHQALTRYPNLSQHKPVYPDRDYNPASSQDSVTINRNDNGQYNRNYDPEPTGPPHGFYYNFDYPVYLLRNIKESSRYGTVGYNNDQYNVGKYNNYDYNNSNNNGQYNEQSGSAEYKKYNNEYDAQYKNQQQGSYNGQYSGQYNEQHGTGLYKKYNNEYDAQFKQQQQQHGNYKRTVEAQVASPAVKTADLSEARVDAVHDAQVSPKQRAALDATKAEGQ